MIANVIWIEAIIQRPAMRLRTSRPASRARLVLEAVGELVGAAHRLAEQDPGDGQRLLDERRHVRQRLLALGGQSPALRADPARDQTNSGSRASAKTASCQPSRNIATTVAITVVTVDSTEVAVDVTTFSTPPMSFAIRPALRRFACE